MLQNVFPEQVERALRGDAAAQEWTKHFVALGAEPGNESGLQ